MHKDADVRPNAHSAEGLYLRIEDASALPRDASKVQFTFSRFPAPLRKGRRIRRNANVEQVGPQIMADVQQLRFGPRRRDSIRRNHPANEIETNVRTCLVSLQILLSSLDNSNPDKRVD